ncbi:restriction endonuclease subunit S [Pseudoalteromonas ruthenica]|uniref:restriction endonuclease subunit S n=1 Tax=Pseudoalteromonas ruthenica TaxID=151081 RepID=UPI0006973808|nr:restriction endonuclease subunit S [Pseudoalteromonas ruthenica]TMO94922.1 restriction endonuclease subunit S [Pseudoalteromonas ruthenica]TMO97053.1 restriction endonuclease subunit S [Pseudoalteromonas ruthenica]TMP06421.1 restriction endonuclease subunit S [Pseudoalteromonas ruthenica]TMP13272.1 restriction endonuclease subunit S [Pseudoalteromonas ruthenica]
MDTVLPIGWIECPLSAITDDIVKIDKNADQELPIEYVDISAINNELNVIEETKSFLLKDAPSRAKQIVKVGDVLFSLVRPYLKNIAAVPERLNNQIASTGFCVLRPSLGIDHKFLFYKVVSGEFINIVSGKQYGVSYPAVKEEQITGQLISLPPLNEQKRIVAKIEELFSELDNGIAALKTAREQLKVYRQAVLKHAFEGKLTAKWREENADKLESPEQLIERIQQEREARYQQQLEDWKAATKAWEANGKEGKKTGKPKEPPQLEFFESALPFGWLTVSLSWLLTTDKKPMTTGPFGTALKKSEHQSDGVPVLGIENIGNGKFIPGNKIFVTQEKAEELASFAVHPGEIVISRSGTVGEICEVPAKVNNALISTNLLRVSLDNETILSPFFVLMFQGGGVKLQVKDLCKGSSREFLNQSILSSIKYPVCGIQEQKALLEQLETIFSNIDQQEKDVAISLEKAETLRQSILKKAFSGQLVPQDPNDEPASELLTRIQAEKVKQQVAAKVKPVGKSGAKRGLKSKVAT